MHLGLRAGITFCCASGRLVFLDTVADRYFMLEAAAEAEFRAIIGEPVSINTSATASSRLQAGMLSLTEHPSVIAPVDTEPSPTRSYLDDVFTTSAGWRTVAGAAVQLHATRRSLKRRGLAATLGRLQARLNSNSLPTEDVASLRGLATAFERLTGVISPLDQCLPRAIALASLASRHATVRLMIGVKLRPFLAHSWVESPSSLINERHDVVRNFTPILVV